MNKANIFWFVVALIASLVCAASIVIYEKYGIGLVKFLIYRARERREIGGRGMSGVSYEWLVLKFRPLERPEESKKKREPYSLADDLKLKNKIESITRGKTKN